MHQTANSINVNNPIIFNCIKKVKLFDKQKPVQNRRFKDGFELNTEKEIAAWLRRPIRTFVNDFPTYPWLPPEPLANQMPRVNFDLNFQ